MMLEYFRYTQTPAGVVINEQLIDKPSDLLGVSSFSLGEFEVKAKGVSPQYGDTLLLPVKGSKQLSLALKVLHVAPLITPLGAWNAKCSGPSEAQFNVKFAQITCDRCSDTYELEFVDFSGNTQVDAIAGMNKQGWQASLEEQVCPSCQLQDNEKG